MTQLKTYIPADVPADIERIVGQLLPARTKKNIIRIADKIGQNLYLQKISNRQACWDYVISKRDADLESRFMKHLISSGKFARRNEPEFIFEYMESIGFRDDYDIVCSWDPRELTFYIDHICRTYHLPVPSMYDVFNMDIKQFFSSYTKKNCDKTALAYTLKIQKAIEVLFAETSTDERFRIQACISLYLYDQPVNFDSMHEILHKA